MTSKVVIAVLVLAVGLNNAKTKCKCKCNVSLSGHVEYTIVPVYTNISAGHFTYTSMYSNT